jgi:enediyne biosynthesis protein E4
LRCVVFLAILIGFSMSCGPRNRGGSSAGIGAPPEPETHAFLDVTEWSKIDFTHSIGDDHLSNLVESVGGGAAWLDYDQDGWLDLYVVTGNWTEGLSEGHKPSGKPSNRLFRNKGDGSFEDVTAKAGVGYRGYGMGVTVADFNNDGYPDIYVSNYGPNVLFMNDGKGGFVDITEKAGVAGNECSVGAAWLDYDNDGLLDLYVGNYITFDPEYSFYYAPDGFPGPLAYDGQSDRLYRNLGDGTFGDVTEAMGVYNPDGRAMGVGAVDYDNDGWMDIYVANDHMINYFYHNEGGKSFRDVGIQTGTAFNQVGEETVSMAVDFADYDGDGLIDLLISDDTFNSLFKNQGNGVFVDMAFPAGIAIPSGQHIGWATAFLDFDNDGDVDIFKVNGHLKHLYGMEDQLFQNDGAGKFQEVSSSHGEYFRKALVGRGACFGDFDNDGDVDMYIVNLDDHGVLLRNSGGPANNWLLLQLVGTRSNRDGIGARVAVTAGGKTQVAQRKGASGYLSSNDPRLHFGLGPNATADRIEIAWPSGTVQVLEQVAAGQILVVEESNEAAQ